uniref:Uncharacterized protein n=1 Tax=Rhizophora mucronata TaxID=61149 RepID=A0A2P2NUW1_RHIMU
MIHFFNSIRLSNQTSVPSSMLASQQKIHVSTKCQASLKSVMSQACKTFI